MKHVLSRTIALVYGAGMSFAVASDSPRFDSDFSLPTRSMPVILKDEQTIHPIVNPFPPRIDFTQTEYPHPLITSPLPEVLAGMDLVTNPQIRWAQATVDDEGLRARQLRTLHTIKSEYEEQTGDLDRQKRALSETLAPKQKEFDEYDQYLKDHNVSLNTKSSYGETSISEHIQFLEGRIRELKLSSSTDNSEFQQVTKSRELMNINGTKLSEEISELKKEIEKIDMQLSSIQASSLSQATQIYESLLKLKSATPVDLKQFGHMFDGGTLVSPGEVRVSLLQMGIPDELAAKSRDFFTAALGNFLWPVFSPQTQTRPISLKSASHTDSDETRTSYSSGESSKINQVGFTSDDQGGHLNTQEGFLRELKARTVEVKTRLQANFTQHVEGTAALINVMDEKKIDYNLDPLFHEDELYTHITKKAGTAPDNDTSLFLQSFLTKELFKDYEQNVTERLVQSLRPTNKTAVLLLTSGIMKNPPVLAQISSRTLPSDEAIRLIYTVKRGQEANPAAINSKLLESLRQITAIRFNIKLVDHILARFENND
jgi:hypothetical protein